MVWYSKGKIIPQWINRRAQPALWLGTLTRGENTFKAYLLYDYQNSLPSKFDIKTDSLLPGSGQLKTWLSRGKAQPALQFRWGLQMLIQHRGLLCRHAGSIFSTSRFSGQSVPRARKTLLTKIPPAWHWEQRNWRRKSFNCQILAQSLAELVQSCCVALLRRYCLAGLKLRRSPCYHCPRLPTKLLHQYAAIPHMLGVLAG